MNKCEHPRKIANDVNLRALKRSFLPLEPVVAWICSDCLEEGEVAQVMLRWKWNGLELNPLLYTALVDRKNKDD